jgi:hypothetical protein
MKQNDTVLYPKTGVLLTVRLSKGILSFYNNLNLHLWLCGNKEIEKYTGCYIYVTEPDQLNEEHRQPGLIHPNGYLRLMPWGLRQFAVADNNSNILYFTEYKAS